jgi:glycosyltransferase involved in cell wall biosynthesis
MKVIFAGGSVDPRVAEKLKEQNDIVEFFGPYEYTRDIKRLYSNIDLVYAVYDDKDRNCQLAMPNKFYEAIIAKIPIIVAQNTFVGSEVIRLGIGCVVRTGDVNGLAKLLMKMPSSDGWHARAIIALDQIDVRSYFEAYEMALAEAIG